MDQLMSGDAVSTSSDKSTTSDSPPRKRSRSPQIQAPSDPPPTSVAADPSSTSAEIPEPPPPSVEKQSGSDQIALSSGDLSDDPVELATPLINEEDNWEIQRILGFAVANNIKYEDPTGIYPERQKIAFEHFRRTHQYDFEIECADNVMPVAHACYLAAVHNMHRQCEFQCTYPNCKSKCCDCIGHGTKIFYKHVCKHHRKIGDCLDHRRKSHELEQRRQQQEVQSLQSNKYRVPADEISKLHEKADAAFSVFLGCAVDNSQLIQDNIAVNTIINETELVQMKNFLLFEARRWPLWERFTKTTSLYPEIFGSLDTISLGSRRAEVDYCRNVLTDEIPKASKALTTTLHYMFTRAIECEQERPWPLAFRCDFDRASPEELMPPPPRPLRPPSVAKHSGSTSNKITRGQKHTRDSSQDETVPKSPRVDRSTKGIPE